MVVLSRRAIPLPVVVGFAPARRRVLRVAQLLIAEQTDAALAEARALQAQVDDPAAAPARLELMRAAAIARVLLDLHLAGWELSLDGGGLYALAPRFEGARARGVDELRAIKASVQRAMGARVREQVATRGTARLVEEVEGLADPRVLSVLARGEALAEALRARGAEAIQPRLETARRQDGKDPTSGVNRYALFRYLRFHWSFPFGDTPGRSLPVLIRDAGQPGDPICGLLCLSSPVLRLTARDDALGLTPAWLEAVVAGLDLPALSAAPGERRAALRAHLDALCRALEARGPEDAGPSLAQVIEDLSLLFEVSPTQEPRALVAALATLPPARLGGRALEAARRVALDLAADLRQAIAGVNLEGLGWTLEDLLATPARAAAALAELGAEARERWQRARGVEQDAREARGRPGVDAQIRALRAESNEHLFSKKRATQLAGYLQAWAALEPVLSALALDAAPDAPLLALRAGTSRRAGPWLDGPRLTRGEHVSRGLSEALLQRKVRVAASQIADVSLCGAIPPYNLALGGKLAALLALSAEAAGLYHDAYAKMASTIQSRMSGAEVVRPAELLALTTTSLYEVGSAQYARLRLPDELDNLAWREVGKTRGHGSLHLSREAVALLSDLLVETRGHQLITSTFGEGPSERLRKLRDGLALLDLPADDLLQHGMPRLMYVAPLSAGTRPGVRAPREPHHQRGPTVAQLASFWRARWLEPRLPAILASPELERHDPRAILLSARFPAELAAGRAIGPEEVDDDAGDSSQTDGCATPFGGTLIGCIFSTSGVETTTYRT